VKVAADTSVIVASFASWHEHHALAFAAISRVDAVIVHCLLETYSVLTRLPAPHRMSPEIVSLYLDKSFDEHDVFALPAAEQQTLVGECVARGLAGGAVYDALIAATCAHSSLKLLTLDQRARQTYALFGVDHELLA
jgi:predicted nucleic acid-binding protein